VVKLDHLFGELLDFPAYTVAAINGHAFAGGAMISSTFDYRIMREDRGYWCMNEAELSLPLAPTMMRTLLARLPQPTVLEAANTARRFSAAEAITAGIAHEAQPEDTVVSRAIEKAAEVATKDRQVIATHKKLLFGEFADYLRSK
jgi:enoyl-CoA hydratase/carnithine racemase